MWKIMSRNIVTGEVYCIGKGYPTKFEAEWDMNENVEFDEDDNPEDWELWVTCRSQIVNNFRG